MARLKEVSEFSCSLCDLHSNITITTVLKRLCFEFQTTGREPKSISIQHLLTSEALSSHLIATKVFFPST